MGKWIKVYFNRDQYNEWRSGNGKAIGYTEVEATAMKEAERLGLLDFGLEEDPLNHMTKVPPHIVQPFQWNQFGLHFSGVYVANMDRGRRTE